MAIITPTITRIYRITEFDLLRTNIKMGNMYMCLDTQRLYYDETDNRRAIYPYISVSTMNDMTYRITPSANSTYYCWEDNSLWLWNNKWIILWSDNAYPSAYTYDDWDFTFKTGNISPIYNGTPETLVLDNNGLLKDRICSN